MLFAPFPASDFAMRPTPFTKAARCIAVLACASIANIALARQGEPPYSLQHPAALSTAPPMIDVAPIDAPARRADEALRRRATIGPADKRLLVADDNAVGIEPARDGLWTLLPDGSQLWRTRVRAAGATDLRLRFAHFALPAGATLYVIGADSYYQGPYTAADDGAGGFSSPVVPGDAATVELRIPPGAFLRGDALELTHIGAGFRDRFGRASAVIDSGVGTSGECNVNVACPLGTPYPNEIRAVGYYEFQADDDHEFYLCSGTLLVDVPRDRRNYFLTAAHCITSASEANSVVVYWNYQSTQCAFLSPPAGGYLNDDQHDATLRARRTDVDFALVELAGVPESAWHVYYAGWDASGTAPSGTIGIHHPSGDVKKITAGPAPTTTDNCIASGTNTHWWTGPYSQGTTEGGSSGSGLFVVSGNGGGHDRLLIGTLSGGYAACSDSDPSQPNDENDCYGNFSVGWNGASASSRLRDWLDPANTGAQSVAGIDSQGTIPSTVRGHSHHARPPMRTPQEP